MSRVGACPQCKQRPCACGTGPINWPRGEAGARPTCSGPAGQRTTSTRQATATLVDRSRCTARRHGNYSAYRYGCRCLPARIDNSRYKAEHRILGSRRRLDATGTTRRLQALHAIGWPAYELAARLGIGTTAVQEWTHGSPKYVFASTYQKVCRLYDELSMTPGPSNITRRRARARGYVPPLAWDDDEIDDPAATPAAAATEAVDIDWLAVEVTARGIRCCPLTRDEQAAVVERLWHEPVPVVADRLGVPTRTVDRIRRRLRGQQKRGAAA